MTQSRDNLIWIDLEMTGLDPANDRIIEIATIVTDAHLNVLAEGPVMAVHQSDALLNGMDEWNTEHHNNSGLVERVRTPRDRRAVLVRLTAAGRRRRATLQRSVPPLQQSLTRGLSASERNRLCRLLEKYIAGAEQQLDALRGVA